MASHLLDVEGAVTTGGLDEGPVELGVSPVPEALASRLAMGPKRKSLAGPARVPPGDISVILATGAGDDGSIFTFCASELDHPPLSTPLENPACGVCREHNNWRLSHR